MNPKELLPRGGAGRVGWGLAWIVWAGSWAGRAGRAGWGFAGLGSAASWAWSWAGRAGNGCLSCAR
ncbi:hypothetical protein BY996DRAFT_6570903 [Phakopsora pachyrhizi]|uniref:Uncharacterized protein n=1 Tax=Phakopsora pachyrhizi TaxID=170000 RepID=A0AAV0BPI7_PHAPC|nr:hypothetical protein BY996DRAFT_6570903 [Phakopsora pachyrhizi]CAH7687497.1 hypothetical protein PPACK8108_LOCUS22288 [Phakopsora pachyrhizi]